jgi:hypothetical protein
MTRFEIKFFYFEQRRIAEILSAIDKKLELECRRKERLESVKKGLMNELLTGEEEVESMIKSLQHLKALQRAPQGTLAFRSYLLMIHGNLKRNKVFGGLEAL